MEVVISIPRRSSIQWALVQVLLIVWMVLFVQMPINWASTEVNSRDIRVLVLGDSLSAGYGLDQGEAFPALVEKRAREAGLPVTVINAGVSGDTTASGLRRIDWLLRSRVDLLLLELGANDGLRGVAPDATHQNLQRIIDRARASNRRVEIVIAGMMVPPNMGADYSNRFREIFPALAADNDAYLIPFLLEGVAGDPSLNLPDGIHPNPTGHRKVAENVWQVLGPVLKELASSRSGGRSSSSR